MVAALTPGNLEAGFDLYVTASTEPPAKSGAEVVRMRITQEVVDFLSAKMRLVSDSELLSVKVIKYPEAARTDSDCEDCCYWTLVIDDEGWRLEPDEGPKSPSVTVFLDELRSAVSGESSPGYVWHAGALLVHRSSDPVPFIAQVESSFPELRAEFIRRQMVDSISRLAAPDGAGAPLRRARNV